jgi:hypothetical protein
MTYIASRGTAGNERSWCEVDRSDRKKSSKKSYRALVLFIDAPLAPNNDHFHR